MVSNVVVLREMNADYQLCVSTCKQLSQHSSQFDLVSQSSMSAASLTTDRLLYSCAIEMVCLAPAGCQCTCDNSSSMRQCHYASSLTYSPIFVGIVKCL